MKNIQAVDKNAMINFCVNAHEHYLQSKKTANKIKLSYPKPENIIIAGMGGSAIGGDLVKDWARTKVKVPIEVCREYSLPEYANKKTLVIVCSYSGGTEESLCCLLDALKRKCMVFCVSSGGELIEVAQKLKLPYCQVAGGMPPRAALPHMFLPLMKVLQKVRIVPNFDLEFNEAMETLKQIVAANSPDKPKKENQAKTLAIKINGATPAVYGYEFYRSVAQRFKQQINENVKIPAKSENFPELDHNELMGWQNINGKVKDFAVLMIRDKDEPIEVKSRIEATKKILGKWKINMLEVQAQGSSVLAKMISTINVGDFISVYLATLQGTDPTPVNAISGLKKDLGKTGLKEKTLKELEKMKV
jgi:glucose/mannose-6-phosphate isomerase